MLQSAISIVRSVLSITIITIIIITTTNINLSSNNRIKGSAKKSVSVWKLVRIPSLACHNIKSLVSVPAQGAQQDPIKVMMRENIMEVEQLTLL